MSVLIKGLKMPSDGMFLDVVINADGKVFDYYMDNGQIAEAVELPDHGDLIDRDDLKRYKRHSTEFCENVVSVANVDWMPTIIPAERSEEC